MHVYKSNSVETFNDLACFIYSSDVVNYTNAHELHKYMHESDIWVERR